MSSAQTNAAGNVTQIAYYLANEANAGKPKTITAPSGKKTWFDYNSRGQKVHTWGDVPYPEETAYDGTYGDLPLRKNLLTPERAAVTFRADADSGHQPEGRWRRRY